VFVVIAVAQRGGSPQREWHHFNLVLGADAWVTCKRKVAEDGRESFLAPHGSSLLNCRLDVSILPAQECRALIGENGGCLVGKSRQKFGHAARQLVALMTFAIPGHENPICSVSASKQASN
jgi:hypothetical protein